MKPKTIALVTVLSFTLTAQRRVGQSNISVPVPPDPHELVSGVVQPPAPGARGTALELLQRALQNSRLQNSGMAPFRMDVSFTSTGDGAQTGQGQFTQVWLSPRVWRWTASLGGTTVVRGSTPQGPYADSTVAVPMRIHMLRNAIFSSVYDIAIGTQLRTAAATWNQQPATCMMTSGVVGPANYPGRLWEELEYCFDNGSGQLVSSSFAPGAFTVYSYAKNQSFHGHTLPDHITVYIGGNQVLDASLQISDAAGTDPNSLAPSPDMVARGTVLDPPMRQPMPVAAPAGTSRVSPVMVHANVVDGKVLETEVCAASDTSLVPAAIEAVKRVNLGPGIQQQAYFTVKFVPAAN
jgi:hypothetical protein